MPFIGKGLSKSPQSTIIGLQSIVSSESERLATPDEVTSNGASLPLGPKREGSGHQPSTRSFVLTEPLAGSSECPVMLYFPLPQIRLVSPEISRFVSFGGARFLYLRISAQA